MTLKIDKSGRVVLPQPLRKRLGIRPDTELEVVEQAGGVLLRRVEEQPAMIRVDGLWIHRGKPTPDADWERVLEDVREERNQSLLSAK